MTIPKDAFSNLKSLIESKQATVAVMGLGYVGLPLIDAYVKAGFRTIGFDVDERKTDLLNAGKTYIAHIENSIIGNWLAKKKFEVFTPGSNGSS